MALCNTECNVSTRVRSPQSKQSDEVSCPVRWLCSALSLSIHTSLCKAYQLGARIGGNVMKTLIPLVYFVDMSLLDLLMLRYHGMPLKGTHGSRIGHLHGKAHSWWGFVTPVMWSRFREFLCFYQFLSVMSELRRAQCMAVTLIANREGKCLRVIEQCNNNFCETPLLWPPFTPVLTSIYGTKWSNLKPNI